MDFKNMEKDGLIIVNKHPEEALFIANYTAKVQYDRLWTDKLLQCRGLIFDHNEQIIARPFPKFFNLSEHEPEEIPVEPFEVFEKMDGSLGILYWIGDTPYISTRGSFTSEQALEGTCILNEKYTHLFDNLNKEATYLFEIIYPENRIVVDYKDKRDLVLLAVIDTKTGKDLAYDIHGFNTVKKYSSVKDLSSLVELNNKNKEGFVVRYASGFRIKVKFEEYVRLHKIITQVSSTVIWEHLKDDKPMDELLEKIPDELYEWIKFTKKDLINQFNNISKEANKEWKAILKTLPENHSEKDFALVASKRQYPSLLFSLNKGRDMAPRIWAMIRPDFEKPFSI